jgi:two-component system, sensor histidine kinase and response regulator
VRTVYDCIHAAASQLERRDEPASSPAGAGTPQAWPPIAGVDTAQAAHRLGGDLDLFLKSLQRLLNEFDDWARDQGALPDDPLARNALATRLHKLRGIAGTLGITELMQLAQTVETGLLQPAPAAMLDAPWLALGEALAELQRHSGPVLLAASRRPPVPQAEVAASEAELPHLLDLLQRQDLDALTWWSSRTHWLQGRFGVTLFARVSHLLDDLDFAGASAALSAATAPFPAAALPETPPP